jgi:hypothetical protein
MASKWTALLSGVAAIATGGLTATADVIISAPPSGYALMASQTGSEATARAGDWQDAGETGAIMNTSSDRPLTYTFDAGVAPQLTAIGVTAKNFWGPLPASYVMFDVSVTIDGTYVDTLHIAASDTEWNTGWLNVGMRQGPITVTMNWLNDAWEPGVADANIGVGAVSIANIPSAGSISLASLGLLLGGTRRRR